MVAGQLRPRGVHDERVLAAMGADPARGVRPDENRRDAYADEALPIDAGQTISQPDMVAEMTELLDVQPGDRILEIGTGSGYQAAILAWARCPRDVASSATPTSSRPRRRASMRSTFGLGGDPRRPTAASVTRPVRRGTGSS